MARLYIVCVLRRLNLLVSRHSMRGANDAFLSIGVHRFPMKKKLFYFSLVYDFNDIALVFKSQ